MRRLALSVVVVLWAGQGYGEVVVWEFTDGGNGHAYEVVHDTLFWAEAKVAAETRMPPKGFDLGHLATFSNAAENDFVYRELTITYTGDGTWAGFVHSAIEGEWRWIDDTPGIWQHPAVFSEPVQTAYTNWLPEAPHLDPGAGLSMRQDKRWNTYTSPPNSSYLVEYEPSDILVWDKLGNGVWSAIDGNPAESRWLNDEGGPTDRYPNSDLTWAVVDVDTVVLSAPRQVDRLVVIGGGVTIADGVELQAADFAVVYDGAVMTLGNNSTFSGNLLVHGTLASDTGVGTMKVIGSLAMEDGAEFACDVGQTGGASDRLVVTESLTLNGDNALTLRFSGDAPFKSGGYTLVTAGEIVGKFDSVSGLGDYVDMGDILQLPESILLTINADLNAGDANLDRDTDVSDFNIWNAYKFTSETDWRTGDFNGDGTTDVRDFNLWNGAKFTRAGWKGQTGGPVPEPGVLVLLAVALGLLAWRRRNG